MASPAPGGSSRRFAIVGPSAAALARLRGGFIRSAVSQDCPVLALAPDVSAGGTESLLAFGAKVKSFSLRPPGFTLFPKRKALAALAAELKDWHPHTLLAFGASILPLAVIAARRAKVAHVAALVSEIPPAGFPNRVRAALRAADIVIAHNADDERKLTALLVGTKAKVTRVAGTGADLSISEGVPMPAETEPLVFLASSRLDRVKGVHDYLEAARIAHDKGLNAKFLLAGTDGTEAGAMKADTLTRYASCVQYLGDKTDEAAAIRAAHVFVSPSHLEGMPPAVLSALAAARPIIATAIPGSRDTVDEMVNGTLVPPSDPNALAQAFERLDRHRTLLASMSRASRAKAERVFNADDVNAALLSALQIA